MNMNLLLQQIALEQNIKIGSLLWNSCGLQAIAYTTGGHAAYGWNHYHIITDGDMVKGVISNYASRPIFYIDEPLRKLGYGEAGRPITYVPETIFDLQDGHVILDNVKISGLDLHHFHIGPLIAVLHSNLATPEQKQLVKWLVRGHMHSMAGQLRHADPNYWLGDRVFANVVKASLQAFKEGLIINTDYSIIIDYISKCFIRFEGTIPKQESDKLAQGVTPSVTGVGNDSYYYQQLYNGLYWYLPAVYDCLPILWGDLKTRAIKLVVRWSKHIQDLNTITNGKIGFVSGVSFPPSMIGTIDESWLNVTVHNAGTSESWAIRAIYVAAKVLGDNKLTAVADALSAKYIDEKEWTVTAEGNYVKQIVIK